VSTILTVVDQERRLFPPGRAGMNKERLMCKPALNQGVHERKVLIRLLRTLITGTEEGSVKRRLRTLRAQNCH